VLRIPKLMRQISVKDFASQAESGCIEFGCGIDFAGNSQTHDIQPQIYRTLHLMLYTSQLPTSVSVTEDPSAPRMDSNFTEKHSNFTAFLRAARRKHSDERGAHRETAGISSDHQ
jgi:hypothetical protein